MSNELITLNVALPALPQDIVDSLTKPADYLDRLQLFQGVSDAVKEGKIQPGHFGVVSGERIIPLGPEIDLIVFAVQAKAIDVNFDPIVVSTDPQSELFKRIRNDADTLADSGCMYGLEFLVFERSTGQFYTYFANSASARREAPKMVPTDGKPKAVTVSAKYIKKPKFSWHAPEVKPCSVGFLNLPDEAQVAEALKKFTASPEAEEAAPAPKTTRVR